MKSNDYKIVDYTNLDPKIKKNGCLNKCKVFFEKRLGSEGPFFFCHKCSNTISMSPRGDIDEPCGVCTVCKGFLFWRINQQGQKWKACWSYHKHFKKY